MTRTRAAPNEASNVLRDRTHPRPDEKYWNAAPFHGRRYVGRQLEEALYGSYGSTDALPHLIPRQALPSTSLNRMWLSYTSIGGFSG